MPKVLSRSKLIGMEVYNPDATKVGTVRDLGLSPEEGKIFLIIATVAGGEVEVPWDSVGEVGDIILLKEAVKVEKPAVPATKPAKPEVKPVAPTAAKPAQVLCPTCGKPARWIPQYKRWWCDNCKKYLPPTYPPPSTTATPTTTPTAATPTTTPTAAKPAQVLCPTCGKPARWIPQYKRWWCDNCRKYL